MSDTTIQVEHLSKLYHIGKIQQRHDTLREALVAGLQVPVQRLSALVIRPSPNGEEQRKVADETIWALKDVSFEVKRGQVVGIIGRNGAGKSTLLKILTRITEPTQGRAEMRGRVGSLLEVGTGFHPELTGRENIYLNGAIMGMQRKEIDLKFDEIVAFAEIDRFIDTPVKRYSSGMYVRLAFAVAAHLEPEILLVDEVLAVGDASFQKKCLGKMGDVAKEGRTILFVSHNMVAVQSLCGRTIWLQDSQIKEEGQTEQVVSDYLQTSFSALSEQKWDDIATSPGNALVRLHRVCVRPENGLPSDPIRMDTPFVIEVEYWNLAPDARLHVTLHLYNEQQIIAFTTGSVTDTVWHGRSFPSGLFRSVCKIPGNLLNSGYYRVLLLLVQDMSTVIYQHEDMLSFDVLDMDKRPGAWFGKEPGVVLPILEWKTEYLDEKLHNGS
jgi:lipopolysaccharide transport system ATP-binding protein